MVQIIKVPLPLRFFILLLTVPRTNILSLLVHRNISGVPKSRIHHLGLLCLFLEELARGLLDEVARIIEVLAAVLGLQVATAVRRVNGGRILGAS